MNEKNERKSPLKICVIFLIMVFVVCNIARYVADEEFRDMIDARVLKKELEEATLATIELNSDANPFIFAYDKYINVLSKNNLVKYTADGTAVKNFEVNISEPLIDSNGKYLVLAEKKGQNIYLISDSNIVWQNKLEGSIANISVNDSGYVSVVLANTTYKSVIVVFNPEGVELFRRYISNNYAICTDISTNNEFLVVGEIDYSGTMIKSYVKVISISLAQTDPNNSLLYTYDSNFGDIITNIVYNKKNEAICMFDTYIQKVTNEKDEKIYEIKKEDLFLDIKLKDNIAIIDKESSGLFTFEYELMIKSTENKTENLYILNSDVPKNMIISGDLIGLNFGNEVQIVNSNGWLIKKYTSSKEIKNLVLGDNIAGVVYKNKIEIINL